jgi:hypothetical protein
MMKKTGNHALPAAPITHLTLRHGRGKVTLSSSAYKYQRRNQQVGGAKFWRRRSKRQIQGGKARKKQKKKGRKTGELEGFFERESEGDRERETDSFGEKKR